MAYEIVLANGSIATATETTNPSLWRALRGGGGNLGIVTKFTFSTFPIGLIWAGDVYFPASTVGSQLSAFYNFTSNPEYDVDAGLMLNMAYSPATGALLTNQYAYAKPVVNPPAFHGFTSIPGQLENTTAILQLGAFAIQEGEQSPNGYQ